jgi:carboxypeptidase family protein/TonB-dependent receptor-like protein
MSFRRLDDSVIPPRSGRSRSQAEPTGRAFALLAILCFATVAGAQETGGTISGTITDAQQGFLPGVTVTLVNEATNASLQTVTNERGAYVLPFVPIGRYTITATLDGFSTASRTNIELRVADRLRFDLTLQVGTRSEVVTISAESPLLDTNTASRGQVISRDQVQDLPLLGRNPFMLATLSTGVQYAPALASRSNRPFDNGGMEAMSISGGRTFTNDFLLDGVPNTGTETNQPNNLSFVPSPDATAEFKVQTNIYDAQYGRTGGGVINVVLRSGTNELHADAYMYYRDGRLNANTSDANRLGQPKGDLYWREPGLTVSGPVRLPGLYDGRDKTFFMYSWEQIHSQVPFPQVYTVATDLERIGDFSQTRTANGQPVIIYDPLTTRLVNGQYVRDPFPGNVIPRSRMNPVALALLQRMPPANAPGQFNNFLVPDNPRADKYNQHTLKLDQVINSSNRFFVRLAWNKRSEINQTAGFPVEASPWYLHGRENMGASVDLTSTLSPSMVLSSRAGFIRHDFDINVFGDNFDVTQLGLPSTLASQLPRETFPRVQLENYTTFGSVFVGESGSIFTTSDTWSWAETLSKVAGSHSLKMGSEFRVLVNDQENPTSSFGVLNFTRSFTGANPLAGDAASGNALASLLLGYPASGSSPVNPHFKYRNNYYAVFLQDDWRLSRKLTLNLGVRWDYESPITEASAQQNRGFDQTATSPLQVPGRQLRGGLLFVDGQHPRPFKRDLDNIQPRFGAAYQLTDRTVVRGGYGISYLPTFDPSSANGFSTATPLVASVDGGLTPAVTLSNPYPNGIDRPVGSSRGLSTFLGRSFTYSDADRTIPLVHQFSMGVQRELPGRMVVDVSYIGSRTRGLPVAKGINEITAEELALGNALLAPVPNPFQGLLPGTAFNGPTVPARQLMRPYPQFDSITEDRRSLGKADYDALQVRLEKRMARGLQFLVSYTRSRSMEEVAYLNPQDDGGQLHRVVAANDAPHRLQASATYRLPFFATAKGWTGALLGGWQLNGIVVTQSGLPVAMTAGAVWTGVDPRLAHPTHDRWFNTCTETAAGTRQNCASVGEPVAWRIQAPFTLRTLPVRLAEIRTRRPTLLDFSVFKTFNVSHGVRLQVRGEAFNLFNTPWFGAPNTNVTSPAFGTVAPNQANDPRNVQIGVRLSF